MSNTTQPAGMRKSSLELFRIITMLFMLAHHYVVHAGLLGQGPVAADPLSFHSQFILLFGAWGKLGINCFVLFSGYFMCKSHITLRKFLKLVLEILFYKSLVAFAFGVTGYYPMSFLETVQYLIPIRDLNQDFYAGYLVFFLFIPFLNVLVRHMSEKTHVRLLALIFFVYILLETVPGFSVVKNNATWFMCLYIISSYIRLYPKKIFDNRRFWGAAALACLLVSSLSVIVCSRYAVSHGKGITSSWSFVMDSNTLLAVLTALSAFMYFKNARVPQSKVINAIASTTFGVLLIHANGVPMKIWLWGDVLHTLDYHATAPGGILHALIAVPLVFAAASCIELLRIHFIEKPFFRLLDKVLPKVEGRWLRLESKFFKKCNISE